MCRFGRAFHLERHVGLLRRHESESISHSVVSDSLWAHECRPPGSSVHGTLQVRILEWVAVPLSRGSSQPGDRTQVLCIASGFFAIWVTREAHCDGINDALSWREMDVGDLESFVLILMRSEESHFRFLGWGWCGWQKGKMGPVMWVAQEAQGVSGGGRWHQKSGLEIMRASARDDDDRGGSGRRLAVQSPPRTGPDYVACGRLRKGKERLFQRWVLWHWVRDT